MTLSRLAQRLLRAVSSWITDLEYRLRVAWPFAFGAAAPRVFFPGCALTAADPATVERTYAWLKERDPSIELWSDCCGMPLEKFSTEAAAKRGRSRTRALLEAGRAREIITACGNCSVQFKSLGVPGLTVTSLYRLLAEERWPALPPGPARVVHHPCSARIDKSQQADFQALATRLSIEIDQPAGAAHPLACCLVKTEGAMRRREALAERSLLTYCAHCTVTFQADIPTRHVLQEVFGQGVEARWRPRGKLGRFLQYFRFARWAKRGESPAVEAAPRHG